ncbi:hypothetical protein MLD38_029928 [Melastoma candidum]|uniref:Uncharacterized protein n=1 Tax=Melastoma candidum TaxID=119954 RepID=A0ACB9MNP5_9MYRT|nr:hypothetical protein MLD38_029928 [Melastoma candidum]
MDMSQGDNHGNGTMTMMQMSFYWGKGADVLFSGWPGERTGMYVLCLLFVFFLAALLEIFSVALDGKTTGPGGIMARAAGQALVYGIKMGMAYLVMLSVMSFNGGVFIAAVLGHTFGFFVVKARAAAIASRAAANTTTGGSDKP